MNLMNSGVVFYSRNNNTRTAALYLAGKDNSEIVELVEENGGKGLFGLIKNMRQASKGNYPDYRATPGRRLKG
jgi:hypothetical protein